MRLKLSRRSFCAVSGATLTLGLRAGWHKGALAGEHSLGGRPFSDPHKLLPMPAEWRHRPVSRPTDPEIDLALAVDQQLFPALRPLILEFASSHNLRVGLQEGTCGIASSALLDKSADITGMCCPPGSLDRLPGVRYHTIGIAAIALIVHPDNSLTGVDLAAARRLFGGESQSWSHLPVSGLTRSAGEVRAVTRLHCATRPGHWRLLLDHADLFATDLVEMPTVADMIIEVGRNPQAIGYETLWQVADKADRGKVKILRLDGHAPEDADAVATGRYPLYRVFSVTTWSDAPAADAAARELVRHLVDNAHRIHSGFGIIPVGRLRTAGWTFLGDEVIAEPG